MTTKAMKATILHLREQLASSQARAKELQLQLVLRDKALMEGSLDDVMRKRILGAIGSGIETTQFEGDYCRECNSGPDEGHDVGCQIAGLRVLLGDGAAVIDEAHEAALGDVRQRKASPLTGPTLDIAGMNDMLKRIYSPSAIEALAFEGNPMLDMATRKR